MAQTAPQAHEGRTDDARRVTRRRARGARLPLPRALTAPPVWRELLLIVLFYSAYTLTRLLLVQDGTSGAYAHADQILGAERAMGIDIELGLNQALLAVPWLARVANVFYATAHFGVTLAGVVWLYRSRPHDYRWLRTGIMLATGCALAGYWLYPLAPPRFLRGEGFVDPVTAFNSMGLYASDSAATLTNQYAAMPSMHAGWALWCGIVLIRLATPRWAKLAGVLYPLTTVLVILATANHYILDAVAGFVVIGAALALSWLLYHRWPAELKAVCIRVGGRAGGFLLRVLVIQARVFPGSGTLGGVSEPGPGASEPGPAPARVR
jgi:hypothetical protein